MHSHVRGIVSSANFVIGTAITVGLAGLVVSLFVSNPFTTVMPPLMLLGVAVGYLIRNVDLTLDDRIRDVRLVLINYCSIAASVIVVFAANGFTRTLAVHGLLLGLYLLVAVSIVSFDSRRTSFGLIIATGILHRATIYYASAVQIGMDAQFHNRMASAIAASGSMAPLSASKYWYAPVYHLLTASGVTVLGVDVRHAAFLLVTAVTTLLLVTAVYLFLRPIWGESVALFGGLLFVVADRAIFTAIHTTTTSLGVVMVAFLLLYTERYLDTGRRSFLACYGLFVAGLVVTHQLSLFVGLVIVSAYVCANAFWRWDVRWRDITVVALLVGAFVTQASMTNYSGPDGESSSFLTVVGSVMVEHLGSVLEGSSARPEAELPPGEYAALAGADAMSVFHVAGSALLLAFALVGSIYWINRTDRDRNRTALGLGVATAAACVFVYVLPVVGVSTFLPKRWQVFLYVVLAILAAPGLVALVSGTKRRTGLTVALVAVALVLAPYMTLMMGNGAGAADGPLFDDSPGADRLATTPTEEKTYEFTVEYADGESAVFADHVAFQLLHRHYGLQSAVTYETTPGEQGTTNTGEELVVYRGYAQTEHGSYYIDHEGARYHVYGSLPGTAVRDAVVYTDGQDRIVWRSGRSR